MRQRQRWRKTEVGETKSKTSRKKRDGKKRDRKEEKIVTQTDRRR